MPWKRNRALRAAPKQGTHYLFWQPRLPLYQATLARPCGGPRFGCSEATLLTNRLEPACCAFRDLRIRKYVTEFLLQAESKTDHDCRRVGAWPRGWKSLWLDSPRPLTAVEARLGPRQTGHVVCRSCSKVSPMGLNLRITRVCRQLPLRKVSSIEIGVLGSGVKTR